MNRRIKLALAVGVAGALAVGGTAAVAGGGKQLRAWLHGYEEVPAVSTAGAGAFRAAVTPGDGGLAYRLSYSGLEGDVTQAHIHFGQPGVNGGISVFLCSNLGNGPAGTQACPPPPATIEGTIDADDVIGPAVQGIAPGELGELMRAIRAGVTYANVHSTKFPGGEVRGQVRAGWGRGGKHR
ncbi:MAG TPA: CHRD domain-containing protein [Solirubrobacteraceae bacterium]|nr:CHRD domain-containing protein [Solirubrobacteraceae bacterium]